MNHNPQHSHLPRNGRGKGQESQWEAGGGKEDCGRGQEKKGRSAACRPFSARAIVGPLVNQLPVSGFFGFEVPGCWFVPY